jgi:hypothetical protein
LKTEIKARWIEALRNPEAKQVQGRLTELDREGKIVGNCCLGVLCELAVADGIAKSIDHVGGGIDDPSYRSYADVNSQYSYGGESGTLPTVVQEWAGVESHNPRVPFTFEDGTVTDRCMSTLNDSDDQTFAQIADLIEAHL